MKKYYIFYSTSLVFKSEKLIKEHNIKYEIVPTPRVNGNVFCGVFICVDADVSDSVDRVLKANYIEYKVA